MIVNPEVGVPLTISYLTGVPVTPSPQAYAGPALNEGEAILNGAPPMAEEGSPVVHSVYGDGTQVLKGQQPQKLGTATADPVAEGTAHTQLRWDEVNKKVYQAREFNGISDPVRDVDFTAPTYRSGKPRPGHSIPEQHNWVENSTGGTKQRGPGMPIPIDGLF